MRKCCKKWFDCQHIKRNGCYLPIEYCPECGDFLSIKTTFGSLKNELSCAIKTIGGGSRILSIIGGWRDTMNDIETEELLKDFNKGIGKMKTTLEQALDMACERISDSGQEYHEANTKEGWKEYFIKEAQLKGESK